MFEIFYFPFFDKVVILKIVFIPIRFNVYNFARTYLRIKIILKYYIW